MRTSRFGTLIFFGTLLFLSATRPPERESPYEPPAGRDRLRALGTIFVIAGEELVALADSDNVEEHLIVKSERVFDDFASETDFPGPDRLTKPLARKAVRPVVRAVVRYVDKKTRELSTQNEEEFRHE